MITVKGDDGILQRDRSPAYKLRVPTYHVGKRMAAELTSY